MVEADKIHVPTVSVNEMVFSNKNPRHIHENNSMLRQSNPIGSINKPVDYACLGPKELYGNKNPYLLVMSP